MSDAYELVDITSNQDAVDYTRTHNGETWAGELTIDQYILRDKITNNTPHFKGNIKVFQMVKIATSEKCGSCEVLIREATMVRNIDGKAVRSSCKNGSIGAVYIYKQYRNQSLAKIMMEKLVNKCRTELIGEGFLTLHSEIGEYYRRFGFISDEVPKVYIKLHEPKVLFDNQCVEVDVGTLQLMKYLEFSEIMNIYKSDTDRHIENMVISDKITRVEIDPTAEIIDWFHTKSKFLHSTLYQPIKIEDPTNFAKVSAMLEDTMPKYFGMKLMIDGNIAGFIIWMTDYSKEGNSIQVLVIHVRPQYDNNLRIKLLEYLNDYVVQDNKKAKDPWCKIQVWTSEIPGIDASMIGEVKTNTSLSALRMLDEKEQQKLEQNGIKWEINSNIPWF